LNSYVNIVINIYRFSYSCSIGVWQNIFLPDKIRVFVFVIGSWDYCSHGRKSKGECFERRELAELGSREMRGLTNSSLPLRSVSLPKKTFFVGVYYMFLRANIEMNALHVFRMMMF
jgi:hypothetical protein